MSEPKIKRALISVHDKTGIVDFARALAEQFGIEIISTGGTAAILKENGIPVTLVEQVTGFPEMMDGRVKTLHPRIHAAILADRDNPEHMRQLKERKIEPIDMVVVNLYPFEETVADPKCTIEQAIEMIDIGGPCLLRAAAKNYRHVLAVSGRRDGQRTLSFLDGTLQGDERIFRVSLARTAICRTAEYDLQVQSYLGSRHSDSADAGWRQRVESGFLAGEGGVQFWEYSRPVRYGENPHQDAAYLWSSEEQAETGPCVCPGNVVAGESPSFNNYVDASAGLDLSRELTRLAATKACVFVKHTNPCGVGTSDDELDAYRRAYLGDPNAAMGGVLVCDFRITGKVAAAVMDTYQRWGKAAAAGGFFVEVWVAPGFDGDAVDAIQTTKKWGQRVRLLAVGDIGVAPNEADLDFKRITGGMLAQSRDLLGVDEDHWKTVTKRCPSDSQTADLRLAWLVCKHTKSNAITICKDGMLIGNGAGQMSRVMSCRIATSLARENGHVEKLPGSAAASDAFFPFADGPRILIDAGVTAIIQPGGSKRDQQAIAACDEHGVAMVFTGTRHFRH